MTDARISPLPVVDAAVSARRFGPPAVRLWHVVLLAFVVGEALATDVPGFTEPSRDLSLASPESGRIASVDVREGDVVEAGQVVARTESGVLEATRRITETQIAADGKLQRARAELAMQSKRLGKLTGLLQRGHAGQEEVDTATIERDVAAAAVRTAEEDREIRIAERDRIDVQLEQRLVRSPIAGTVVRVVKDAGEFVSQADPVVMRVVRLDPLTGVFNVPEEMAGRLAKGEAADVRFLRTGVIAAGVVEFVSPVIEPQSGTVRVTVSLPNGEGLLRAGEKCALAVDYVEQIADSGTPPE